MDGAADKTHRIRRLSFELGGADEDAMLALRRDVIAGVDALEVALAPVLDAHADASEVIRIERLVVPLGALETGVSLDPAALAAALDRALANALPARPNRAIDLSAPSKTGARGATPVAHLAQTLAMYLRTGSLPWWAPSPDLGGIEAALAALNDADTAEIARHLAPVIGHEGPATRFAIGLTPAAARRLATALPRATGLPDLPAWQDAARAPAAPRAAPGARERLVAHIRRAAGFEGVIPRSAAPHISGDAVPAHPRASASLDTSEPRAKAEEPAATAAETLGTCFIPHAGVILAAPFLKTFFERLGLLRDRAFHETAAAERAVALIGALGGGPPLDEPGLALAKLLAGRPIDAPQPRDVGLTEEDHTAVEALLDAMIGHWTALGQASPSGLRETFLRRPGRLETGVETDRLDVERRGTDVLLDRLPWTLSPIRLPWMARPLIVGWR